MRKIFSIFLFVYSVSISAKEAYVDISSNFPVHELPSKFFTKRFKEFKLRLICPNDYVLMRVSPEDCQKILVFNGIETRGLPNEKLVLFEWEPYERNLDEYEPYARVYTCNDERVDNVKFFRFFYPYLMPMLKQIPRFEKKKLCTMVTGRWEAHRFEVLSFFKNKPTGEFTFYGNPHHEFEQSPMWGGKIPGSHSGPEKINTLKNYRFCFCYENTTHYPGYITEKIFGCLAAGCVPIYWGAPNIEEYIPTNCFIDPRKFANYEELYQFIKSMPKEVYDGYITNIRAYLTSDKARLFSPQHFDEILYEAATF